MVKLGVASLNPACWQESFEYHSKTWDRSVFCLGSDRRRHVDLSRQTSDSPKNRAAAHAGAVSDSPQYQRENSEYGIVSPIDVTFYRER